MVVSSAQHERCALVASFGDDVLAGLGRTERPGNVVEVNALYVHFFGRKIRPTYAGEPSTSRVACHELTSRSEGTVVLPPGWQCQSPTRSARHASAKLRQRPRAGNIQVSPRGVSTPMPIPFASVTTIRSPSVLPASAPA